MRASGNKHQQHSCWRALLRNCLTRRVYFCALLFCVPTIAQAATPAGEHQVRDLHYGHALYQYFQQDELDAIISLMTAEARPRRADSQIDEARLLLADLYYGYGLYDESRALFAQLLNTEVSDSVRNRLWFNLAQLRYQQGYYDESRDLLARINDQLPRSNEAERLYLLTNLYIGNREYDKAAGISQQIDSDSVWKTYAEYNLGVSLIEDNEHERGKAILDQLGQLISDSDELLALRDLSNLSLGLKHLRMGQAQPALESLLRIRLEGPLSNQALLASGWAWYRLQQFDKALVPWRLLLQRNAVDTSTQEAILAIPANYAESGNDRLAIRYYELAAKQFDLQLDSLDNAIQSINADELINALHQSTLLEDRGNLQRTPPISRVTPQLQLLLASSGFHREIKRYQELLDIRLSLGNWNSNFPTLELMLEERGQAFTEKLPLLQQTASFDQYEQFSIRRNQLAEQVEAIEAGGDYLGLANSEELEHLERLQNAASSIDKIGTQRSTANQQQMLRLLSGMLNYQIATDYPRRIWKSKKQLIQLDRALEEADYRVVGLRQITARTQLDLAEFGDRISGQTTKITTLRTRVSDLLKQQQQHINQLAVNAIEAQQQHIRQLRLNARFELARIYDKLTVAQ